MASRLILAAALAVPLLAVAQVDLSDGLVAYYPYEGDANDQSGNANNGVEFGGVAYAAGLPGQALSLDGIDDFVQLPRVVEEDFTVAFWVNTMASAPAGAFWFQGLGLVDGEVCGSPQGGDWGIALLSGGHVSFGSSLSISQINDGAWHSVVVTRDMVQGTAVIYLDGAPEAVGPGLTTPLTGVPWIGVGNNPCDVSFGREYFPGRVDELRFYDRVVSGDEIRLLSQSGIFADGYE